MKDYTLENRRYVIGGVALAIVLVYIIRLFTIQLLSDDFKKNADSNAFLKKIDYPSRGAIYDRNGKLMVYNQPSYDIMVVMNEAKDHIDTLELCKALGISKEFFIKRMDDIKDRTKNPGYSRFTEQLFMTQLSDKEFSVFREKMFRFPGFYVQKRSIRQYTYPYAAHVLGDIGEVSPANIEEDDYYQPGDYIGKLGVEKYYEKELRGEKGVQIMLRDAHGRIQGSYRHGKFDRRPVAGRDLTLSLDVKLQALAERMLQGKIGSVVAIEPATGEVLAMASSPTYDPRTLVGRQRSKVHVALSKNVWKPLLNRSIMGQYPPGSTFKTTQALTYLTEGIITPNTMFTCHHGFSYRGLHVGCHGHMSPLNLIEAISTSCNAYFCWGLYYMMGNRRKYHDVQEAMNRWRDYMVSMGFGYKLGIDLPGEKRGLIPNASFYDRAYHKSWNGLTVISISIGQGEVNLTPLQIANLGATIANRGYYYTPHVVRKVQGLPLDTAFTHRHRTMASERAYSAVVAGMRSSALKGTCKALGHLPFTVCGKTGT
ncbi:MAG: penicillin-binding protein 2, partial [Prevotella salivae]|nr:penicillin-binding protein 2 [Segatella salivae]